MPRRARPRLPAPAICTCDRAALPDDWPADAVVGGKPARERVVRVVSAPSTGWIVSPIDGEAMHECHTAELIRHSSANSRPPGAPRAPGGGRKRSASPAVPWSAEMRQAQELSGQSPAAWTYATLQAGALGQLGLRADPDDPQFDGE